MPAIAFLVFAAACLISGVTAAFGWPFGLIAASACLALAGRDLLPGDDS